MRPAAMKPERRVRKRAILPPPSWGRIFLTTLSWGKAVPASCQLFRGRGFLRRSLRRADPDRLDVGELTNPEMRELAAVTAVLDPAEREPRVRSGHPVDEDAPRFKVRGDPFGTLDVAGP